MAEQTTNHSIQINRPRCPYCHDDIRPDEEKSGCDQCMAWFHRECWNEHGGCTNCLTQNPPGPPSSAPVPVGRLTESPMTPSIHNALGYSLLTGDHRSKAFKEGMIEAAKATALISIPTIVLAVIAFSIIPFEVGVMLMIVYLPSFLLLIFMVMYGTKKRISLTHSLQVALEEKRAKAGGAEEMSETSMKTMKVASSPKMNNPKQ